MRWLSGVFVALLLLACPAVAQTSTPAAVNGGIYRSSLPTLANGQPYPFILDSSGHLLVTVTSGGATSVTPATVTPLGNCQLTSLAAATGLASCSGGIPATSTTAQIQCESQAVRFRDDGTNPTASVGQPLLVGQPMLYKPSDLTLIKFIQQAASATCNISFYK